MAGIFVTKTLEPNNVMVSDVLGETFQYWEEIKTSIEEQFGKCAEEWKFYNKSSGWTLKLLLKKRNLFFLSPDENFFSIIFIFGDKAVHAVEKSELPKKIIQELKNAKRYAEGRGIRIAVKKRTHIKYILTLAEIKVNN